VRPCRYEVGHEPEDDMAHPALATLVDHQQVVDAITDLFIATDEKDWPAVVDCFTPTVRFDMSSAGGGAEADVPAMEIAAGWERGLAGLRAVHHQIGNFRVRLRGDDADASCYGIASHWRPNPTGRNTRTFVGTYDVGLRRDGVRWRINRFRFNLKYVEGNLELERS
jgi:hypothetical protein